MSTSRVLIAPFPPPVAKLPSCCKTAEMSIITAAGDRTLPAYCYHRLILNLCASGVIMGNGGFGWAGWPGVVGRGILIVQSNRLANQTCRQIAAASLVSDDAKKRSRRRLCYFGCLRRKPNATGRAGVLGDHAHELSEIAATIERDDAQCQASGLAPGSRAYLECRTRLANEREGKRSIHASLT